MNIILISGKAQHGKDTVAGFLREALEARGQRVLIAHYGDLVKYICKTFFGWDGQKDEAGRSLLQRVGTDVIRRKDEYFWVNFIGRILRFFPDEWDYVLIPDCRFRNEVQLGNLFWCVDQATHVRVVRPDFDNGLTPKQQAHPSETDLDGVNPDVLFMNDGDLDDLEDTVKQWVLLQLLNRQGVFE